MRNKNLKPEFVQYDDNNIEHVLAGPDYGQPWSDQILFKLDFLLNLEHISENNWLVKCLYNKYI